MTCVRFLAGVAVGCACLTVCADERLPIPDAVATAQQQRIEVMQRASAATIAIFGLDGGGGGSGVLITPDGYALTNYHVSSACGDHMRCGLSDGSVVDAVIVGIDATGDVSLIQLLGRDDFPTAPLGNSDEVRVGQWCFAAGNPFVLATNLQPSISLGIVSGTNRYQYPAGTLLEYADCIQTDAAVNPGNSGGPLFDLAGNVIGINGRCSFEKRGRVNVGVGYAISANQIKYFLGILGSGRLVDHATLGATVSTDDLGKVLVSNILNSSDAYRRGLRYGDEIVRLADREVRTTNGFKNILGTLPKDWRVPLQVRRDGKSQTLLVRLDGVHSEKQLIDLVAGGLEPRPVAPPDPERKPEAPAEDTPPPESESPPAPDEAATGEAAELAPGQPNKQLVESRLETRPGFANYYYNRLRREQLWNALQQPESFADTSQSWQLSGHLAGESTAVAITLGPQTSTMQVGSRSIEIDASKPLSDIVAARRESGLLLALRSMQELLQIGPEKMGATVYLGKYPIYQSSSRVLAEQPLHDVLQTLWYDARARFSIAPDAQQLSLVEVFGDVGQDPVELYVDAYQPLDAKSPQLLFPSRLRLQYGMEPMLVVELDQANFGTKPSAASTNDDTAASQGDRP